MSIRELMVIVGLLLVVVGCIGMFFNPIALVNIGVGFILMLVTRLI